MIALLNTAESLWCSNEHGGNAIPGFTSLVARPSRHPLLGTIKRKLIENEGFAESVKRLLEGQT
jgi:hypothetical protein